MAARYLHTPPDHLQPRTFGYCRVSTTQQSESGISLDEQRHRITARCHEHGWALEHVFVDVGVSGSVPLAKRPQGGRLLAALRPGDTMIAVRLDRCFRSAVDALNVIEGFKRRRIRLVLLDLGDCTGNGVSELILTVLAACAQFEHHLISERIAATKANLRRANKHQGGLRPYGWTLGAATGTGKARTLIPDLAEQAAIGAILEMRARGETLMAIRDVLRAQGFAISHQSVANILERQQRDLVAEAAE
jgi:putative DNA-invertase from lambdoid prophage Rac